MLLHFLLLHWIIGLIVDCYCNASDIKLMGSSLCFIPKYDDYILHWFLMPCHDLMGYYYKWVYCRPEINIGPWDEEFSNIKQGSQLLNWTQKLNYAYWKGNPDVQSPVRIDLLQCNNSDLFGAQIMRQVLCNYHLNLFFSRIGIYWAAKVWFINKFFYFLPLYYRIGLKKENMGLRSPNYQISAIIGKLIFLNMTPCATMILALLQLVSGDCKAWLAGSTTYCNAAAISIYNVSLKDILISLKTTLRSF